MKKVLFAMLMVYLAAATTGCYQTTKTITLNSDGSGKLVLEANFPIVNLMGNNEDSDEDKAKQAVVSLIEEAEGVAAWKDVSFKALEDDRVSFKGTAYFKNISEVAFKNIGDTGITYQKDAKGQMVLNITLGDEEEDDDEDAPEEAVNMTDAEVAAKMKSERAKFNTQVKPMAATILATMREEIIVYAPGALKGGLNLTKTKDGAIRFLFEGAKVLGAMEAVINDDELMKESIKAGRDIAQDGPAKGDKFNELMFGKSGPVRAVFAPPFKQAFNYKLETQSAKAGYQGMLKQIGLNAAMPVPVAAPAKGEGLKSIKVGGVRFVKFQDKKRGIRPFNYDKGYTLSIIAELSGSAISVEEGTLLSVVADNGADLLPEKQWARRLHFPKLSDDKTVVIFGVDLAPPAPEINGFKEISGTFEYMTSAGSDEIDLGFTEFKTGEGKELGASIKVEPSGAGESIELVVKKGKSSIKELKFYDDAGTVMKFSSRSSSWSGSETTYNYEYKTKFPPAGKIVVELYADQKKFKVPFKLENITLLGDPM